MTTFNITNAATHLRGMTYTRARTHLQRLIRHGMIDADEHNALWADYLLFHKNKRLEEKAASLAADAEELSETRLTSGNPPYHYLKPKAFTKKMMDLQSSGKISAALRVRYVERYEKYRKEQRSLGTHREQARRRWMPIKEQLSAEMASVRSGIHYYRKDRTRNASYEDRVRMVAHQRAYETYLSVLSKTLMLIKNAIRAGTTPLQLVELMAQEGKHVPNRGEHWVDWVSPAAKRAVIVEFTALPRLPRTKHRHPFDRERQHTITRSTADNMAMYNEFNNEPPSQLHPGEMSHQTHEGE